jgi:hypothetical protein
MVAFVLQEIPCTAQDGPFLEMFLKAKGRIALRRADCKNPKESSYRR